MKTIKNIYASLILLGTCLLTSNILFAHFGSKGPYGGSVSCGIVNGTVTVLGTYAGGIYFNTGALTGWSAKPVGLKSGKITAIASTGSYLFTGTADSGIFVFTGFAGTDRYWNKVNNGLTNLKIKSLVAIDSITVLAGTDGGGIFKTINKGATWVAVNTASLSSAVITGLVKTGNRIILTSLSGGVFASDDEGDTWVNFNDVNTLNIAGTSSLSYNASTDELLVVSNNGLYIAASASTISVPVYIPASTGLPVNTSIRSISNTATDWYLATDKGIFITPVSAINWASANAGLTTIDITTVIPFQANLIAGTNGEGVFKSSATSISWVANNIGFNNKTTYSIATSGIAVVVVATENGIFVSTDLAANYKRANNGLTDSLNVTDITFAGTNLFAATQNAGIFISGDTGKTWSSFNTGLANLHIKKIFSSDSGLYIFCSNGNVYQSTGFNWTLIQNGLPGGIVPSSLAFYGNNILLGTFGNGIYTKEISASTWTVSSTGLTNLNVTSVAALGSKIFAGTDGAGVFVSDTSSINWTATSNTSISHTALMGLNGNRIQAMSAYAGYVFASYKGGLLATSDNGATWIAGGNQFNLPSYTDVNKISFVTTRVFVTTENNCLYSNSLSELPAITTGINEEAEVPSKMEIMFSPNPNNGTFNFSYNKLNGKVLSVDIYDISGRWIEHFSNTQQQTITVDYPAGIYFVRVNTTNNMITQKIIIE